MNKQRIIEVIKTNEVLNDDDLRSLQSYKDQYPFSQLVHTLLARHHHRKKTPLASSYIQKAAFYTTDRSVLKKFVEAKPVTEDYTSTTVQEEEKVAPQPSVTTPSTSTPPVTSLPPEAETSVDSNEEELIEMRSNIISGLDELAIKKQRMKDFLEQSSKSTPQKKSKKITSTKPKETKKSSKNTTESKKNTKKNDPKPIKSVKKKKDEEKGEKGKEGKKDEIDKKNKKENKKKKEKKGKKEKKSKKTDETENKTKISSDKKKTKTKKIIDRFIENPKKISQAPNPNSPADERPQEDLSVSTAEFSEDFASENLAQILVNQGNKEKAIDIYKKLIWKYPQKKAYFASQIEMLKK